MSLHEVAKRTLVDSRGGTWVYKGWQIWDSADESYIAWTREEIESEFGLCVEVAEPEEKQ